MSKEFEAYPIRNIRISDTEWENLKTAKLKSGVTWNKFIKQLLNDNALNQNNPHRSVRSRPQESLTE